MVIKMPEKHYPGDLKQMQALPLEVKIRMSLVRIKQWYEAFDGNVYVSFSGGKDSTVLLHLVRSIFPDVEAVFCDTGLEYPEIREFVKKQENVTIIRPEMNFKQVIMKYGYPLPTKELARKIQYAKSGSEWAKKYVDGSAVDAEGRPSRYRVPKRWLKLLDAPFDVSAYCCDIMKKKPMKSFEKTTGKKPFIGTMACESKIREQAWLRTGCNAFETKRKKSAPMSFWTENDVLQYAKENGLEIASVYGDIVETGEKINLISSTVPKLKTTKCDRTGCMFCMFGCHLEKEPNRFQRMKETHPKQYEWCMKSVEEGGLGLDDVLTYVEISH
jgi:3'-phosphoadenosine 5'-phosphosulfate sulfotransferase (PAPS reductase)/FAD synthetase